MDVLGAIGLTASSQSGERSNTNPYQNYLNCKWRRRNYRNYNKLKKTICLLVNRHIGIGIVDSAEVLLDKHK